MRGHELRAFHFHACVNRADHLGALRLGSRCPERPEIAQSSDHGARLHAGWRSRRRPSLMAQARGGRQILGVVQVACGVCKRNLLPLSPDAANSKLVGWRSWLSHVPNDPLDGRVIQGERGQLSGQGPVPSLGAKSATVSPRRARTRMQALVAASPVEPPARSARSRSPPGGSSWK
jgi:hypothetical protein